MFHLPDARRCSVHRIHMAVSLWALSRQLMPIRTSWNQDDMLELALQHGDQPLGMILSRAQAQGNSAPRRLLRRLNR